MKAISVSLLLVAASLVFVGCAPEGPKSDSIIQAQQEKMVEESVAQTGLPGVTRFTEKKLMKMLYELRDTNIATYTYIRDMNGRLFHVCDSVGYGLPYGTQYSNPEKIVPYGMNTYVPNTSHVVPQSEPNGLFMPPTAEGTWVMCGTEAAIKPVYVEDRVLVSPFRLNSVGDYEAK